MNSTQLDGVFIQPVRALRWDDHELHLRRMKKLGFKQIIFQWTSAFGYSFQRPSCDRDWIGEILRIAEILDLRVWLGLDACRTITEEHYDPINAAAERCCTTATELVDRYGGKNSLAGLYVPLELDEPPRSGRILSRQTEDLLEKIVSHCHALDREVLYSARKPRLKPEGRHYEFNENDQEWISRENAWHLQRANSWKKIIDATGLDILMLQDDDGMLPLLKTGLQAPEAVAEKHNICIPRLWVQVPLYEDKDVRIYSDIDVSKSAETRIGFSYHDIDFNQTDERNNQKTYYKGMSFDLNDGLLEKADQIEELIHDQCMLHDQIITVVDTRYPLESYQNQWQEDADWLTGLYVGAESFRYAVTGDEEARRYAQASWRALHKLSNLSDLPGIVARHYRSKFEGDLGSGRKRWHRNPDGIYWIGDISRDQLSGHMFGLATYYDLVASDAERKIIEADVEAITDLIIENNMCAVDWDGKPCIHANFWVSPLFALAFLKIAYHITRKESYQEKYMDLIDPHYFLGHALKDARISADPFFQHYHHDSPLYHLLQYETDPKILRHVVRCCDLLYADTRRHANVLFLFDYQICHPESEAGRKGIAELLEFNVSHLNVSEWVRAVRKDLQQEELPAGIRCSLRYILEPSATLPDGKGNYIPLKYRPPKEFGWNYYAGEEARRSAGNAGHHGIHVQYSGVDYLLVYWMGRYHQII